MSDIYKVSKIAVGMVIVADPERLGEFYVLCLKQKDSENWYLPGAIVRNDNEINSLLDRIKCTVGLSPTINISMFDRMTTTNEKTKRVFETSSYQLVYNFPVNISQDIEVGFFTPKELLVMENFDKFPKKIIKSYLEKLGVALPSNGKEGSA